MSRLRAVALATAVAGAGCLGLGLATAPSAGAASIAPTRIGWWYAAGNSLTSAPTPTSVPAGGGYVASSVEGAIAVTAVHFDVPAGQTGLLVALPVASSESLPEAGDPIGVCPIAPGWSAGAAQSLTSAPACLKPAVTAKILDDSVVFDPAAQETGTSLDFEILPAPSVDEAPLPAGYSPYTLTLGPPGNALLTQDSTPVPMSTQSLPAYVPSSTTPTSVTSPALTRDRVPPARRATAGPVVSQPSVAGRENPVPAGSLGPVAASPSATVSAPAAVVPGSEPPEPTVTSRVASDAVRPVSLTSPLGRLGNRAGPLAIAGLFLLLIASGLIGYAEISQRGALAGVGRFRHPRDGTPTPL